MKTDEFEELYNGLRTIGHINADFPKRMIDDDSAMLGTILNFISAELGMLIRANLEMWKMLQILIESKGGFKC